MVAAGAMPRIRASHAAERGAAGAALSRLAAETFASVAAVKLGLAALGADARSAAGLTAAGRTAWTTAGGFGVGCFSFVTAAAGGGGAAGAAAAAGGLMGPWLRPRIAAACRARRLTPAGSPRAAAAIAAMASRGKAASWRPAGGLSWEGG